jgi:hypothetical protein
MPTIKHHDDLVDGDIIYITLDGKPYKTVMIGGVQRFPTNTCLEYMFNHDIHGRKLNMHDGRDIHNCMFNLNTLIRALRSEHAFDLKDFMVLQMSGYSVSGFSGMDDYCRMHLTNPLWENEDAIPVYDTNEPYEPQPAPSADLLSFRSMLAAKVEKACDDTSFDEADRALEAAINSKALELVDQFILSQKDK